MRVDAIMTRDPLRVTPQTGLDEVSRRMDAEDVRHVPVVEGEAGPARERVVGVISDRDLLEATGRLPPSVHACRGPGVEEQLPKSAAEILRPATLVEAGASVCAAIDLLLAQGVGSLLVVRDGRLVGIVTETDVLSAYVRAARASASEARVTVATCSSRSPLTIGESATLAEAIELRRSSALRHLPVMEGDRLVGMLSDRDLRRAVGVGRRLNRLVGELMTPDPLTVGTREPLWVAAERMVERRVGALPVVDDLALVGIVSVSDVAARCRALLGGQGPEPGRQPASPG